MQIARQLFTDVIFNNLPESVGPLGDSRRESSATAQNEQEQQNRKWDT